MRVDAVLNGLYCLMAVKMTKVSDLNRNLSNKKRTDRSNQIVEFFRKGYFNLIRNNNLANVIMRRCNLNKIFISLQMQNLLEHLQLLFRNSFLQDKKDSKKNIRLIGYVTLS